MGKSLDELNAEAASQKPKEPSTLLPAHRTGGSSLTCYGEGGKHYIYLMNPDNGVITKHFFDNAGNIGPAVNLPDWVAGTHAELPV